jgi:hypothetical protein
VVDAFDKVSVLPPSTTELLATPASVVMVDPVVVAEMSKVPAALTMFTPLEDAMLPLPVSASVPPLIVVAPR